MSLDDKFTAIRKGLLEFLILKIVAIHEVYVADILDRLSDTEFATQEGTLYPLLSKMRRDGLVDYKWQESDAGPPRKYYQLTESGYHTLREYLAGAERALEDNPDRTEIIADLEQAIADKCRKFLSPHKTVVTSGEVEQIVREMGPIDAPAAETAADRGNAPAGSQHAANADAPPKRLFRIPDGAMIAGVCTGLAAYLGIDVAFVRVGFALTAFITKGAGIIAYVAMMFLIPEARTSEERASAGGTPFNAKEVIERAKQQYSDGTKQWRRHWRQHRRPWRRQRWAAGAPLAYSQGPWLAPMVPVFALAHVALFLAMAAMMISLVNTGAILGWPLPAGVPVWAGALMLFVGYQIVVSLMGTAFIIWIASNHIPEIREFILQLPPLLREFVDAIRHLFSR